ncbi:tumor necrosis factor ligand superfamily member 6 [Mastacembelus armatus]|uniref:Fas ligand (TNF superfamily, member 6) n=1 Tax=Mastacembelus armatus TaxID=205130 RepID=A0A3Q3MJK0_9TELE|nr:tumor necrosis factor ligand superfamily member 6-like [Mastacembelus armatus]
MSCDQTYPLPQVFLVDGGGDPQFSTQPPNLVPCWSFPPAHQRIRSRGKSQGCMGVSPGLAMLVLLLFLLVFAGLGFEAYQIHNMQTELRDMRQDKPVTEFHVAEKQIGLHEPELNGEDKDNRPAGHVIGRIETVLFPNTLRWEQKAGRAFTSGGVAYRAGEGALQVNESGLYHIYSRVELIFKKCDPTSSFVHSVFVRSTGLPSSLTLMEAHRAGFCAQQPKHSWTTESYLGSALKLQKYDRVFVNVSHPRLLSHTHYANFFGLYKI